MQVDFSKFKVSDYGAFTLMRIPTHGVAEVVTVDVLPGLGRKNLRFDTHYDASACAKHLATLEKQRVPKSRSDIGYAVIPWPTSALVAYDEPKIREVAPVIQEARS